jgi:putative transposase
LFSTELTRPAPLLATRHQYCWATTRLYRHTSMAKAPPQGAMEERRAVALPLSEYPSRYSNRNEAMACAYLSTALTMPEIAHAFGVSTKTVSRALSEFENRF